MKAVIVAGGKGTRLLPYTAILPKPLMPLGEMPIIELVLRQLKAQGVDHVVLAVNHLHHLIRSFLGDGSSLGLRIDYFIEDEPLGTCGALAGILPAMTDDFLLMNGDVLSDIDFECVLAAHQASGASATVVSYDRVFKIEFGVLSVSDDGFVRGYAEKPEHAYRISTGAYVLNRSRIEDVVARGVRMDVPDLLTALMSRGRTVFSYLHDGLWLDIGSPDDYARAQTIVAEDLPGLLRPRRSAFVDSGDIRIRA